jgi:hypothetical protein
MPKWDPTMFTDSFYSLLWGKRISYMEAQDFTNIPPNESDGDCTVT